MDGGWGNKGGGTAGRANMGTAHCRQSQSQLADSVRIVGFASMTRRIFQQEAQPSEACVLSHEETAGMSFWPTTPWTPQGGPDMLDKNHRSFASKAGAQGGCSAPGYDRASDRASRSIRVEPVIHERSPRHAVDGSRLQLHHPI